MLTAEINRERKLGVEYEMTFPLVGAGSGHDVQQALANVLSANGLPSVVRGYSHEPLPRGADFAVEYDSSICGESTYQGISWHPVELKTRILTYPEWESLVPKALEIARYMGGRVNQSCGHHVHAGLPEARARNPRIIRSLFNIVHRFEPVVFGLCAPSRRTNGFSRPMPDRSRMLHGCRTLRAYRTALGRWERYYGLNLTTIFDSSPHVEFRYHQGTLDPEKARHWLRLCLQLVQHAATRNCQAAQRQAENTRKDFDNFRYSIGLKSNAGIYSKVSDELKETGRFLLRRWRHFNEPQPPVSGDDEKAHAVVEEEN